MKPLVIRLYPELWQGKRYFYCEVKLYPTPKQMRAAIKKDGFAGGGVDGVAGQCSGYATYRKNRLIGRFATMWLNTQDLLNSPAEIISHECVHAAMRHVANKKVDLSSMGGEEALAYCQGSMVQQLTDRLHKIGVFKS